MKKNKLPSLVVILILTLITAVMWISFSVYRSLTTKPPPIVPEEVSNPLTPNLDTQTLNQLNSMIFLDSSQIPEISVTQPSTQPTQQETIPPAPTPTATISATPAASPSATP